MFVRVPTSAHRAAIAGKVIDAVTARPIAGVVATITAMPAAFQRWLAIRAQQGGSAWEALAERPDRTVTPADGCFRFVDLPDGAYTVSLALPGGGHRYGTAQRDFAVQRDPEGHIDIAIAVIPLPPTGVRGRVLSQGTGEPLPLARVRVESSGELAYCDADGRFTLTGVELGARRLSMSAAGHLRATATAQIAEGKLVDLDDITLEPATA